ncbi:MAG: hypothetical protein SGI71_00655 [Verrucomicrobiota bacterium]|nr:hypothetical protein [Verrucomicrobiota bacterium]
MSVPVERNQFDLREVAVGFVHPIHNLVAVMIINGTCGEMKHHKRIRDLCSAIYEDL